ncbi:hypothetical protein QBC35DRAFT_501608 [Podospora australis]|uniref:Uncharacterized protein n=1 Tax=Podospora australis TaxID=1536484 RepID=A0AAN7AF45_9PEZI|nr:hypothetical protein QBC35DRAFT_501608 [Podospora australis]
MNIQPTTPSFLIRLDSMHRAACYRQFTESSFFLKIISGLPSMSGPVPRNNLDKRFAAYGDFYPRRLKQLSQVFFACVALFCLALWMKEEIWQFSPAYCIAVLHASASLIWHMSVQMRPCWNKTKST